MAAPKEPAPPHRPPQPPSLKTIEAALELIDNKKESLKRAYDGLQSHSSLLSSSSSSSSFSLSWPDLDSHFTSLQTHLTRRFQLLHQSSEKKSQTVSDCRVDPVPAGNEAGSSSQSLKSGSLEVNRVHDNDPCVSDPKFQDPSSSSRPSSKGVGSELKSLCDRTDGKGLRNYVNEHWKGRVKIRAELIDAMRAAPDPAGMVLDAMEGFYSSNIQDLQRTRKVCSVLLEVLMEIRSNMSNEVREKARNLALDWRKRVTLNWDGGLEALCFLLLVVVYGLQSEFDAGELVDYFFVVARFKPASDLFRAFDLRDRIADVIQKLIDDGMQLLAAKFILEMGLTDKFQLVPLLKAHLKDLKMFTKRVCKGKNSSIKEQNAARSRECNSLRAVLKIVEEHKLQSEYPPSDLQKRLQMLEKQKADAKLPSRSAGSVPQLQRIEKRKLRDKKRSKMRLKQSQQNRNKRAPTVAAVGPAAISGPSSIPPYQHSHVQPPYGLMGSSLPVAPHAGSSAGPYGLAGVATGFSGSPSPATAHPYSSEPPVPSGYYNGPVAYGGYGLPHQYRPTFYPM